VGFLDLGAMAASSTAGNGDHGLSLMLRCEWGRAARFRALLVDSLGLQLRAQCSTRIRDICGRSGATHGGFVWVRCTSKGGEGDADADDADDADVRLHTTVGRLLSFSSFGRFFTALFPTRHVLPEGRGLPTPLPAGGEHLSGGDCDEPDSEPPAVTTPDDTKLRTFIYNKAHHR
jgi:hypothetical protein